MQIKKNFFWLIIACFICSAPAYASDNLKVNYLPNDYLAVGQSSLSVLFWDVYDIQLKTPKGRFEYGQFPLILELTYKREITKQQLVAETLKQWKRFSIEENQKQQWAEKLLAIWPDVIDGDNISFHVDDSYTTFFYHNKIFIGEISSARFSTQFLAIWLAPNGPYPKLTKELIGK